ASVVGSSGGAWYTVILLSDGAGSGQPDDARRTRDKGEAGEWVTARDGVAALDLHDGLPDERAPSEALTRRRLRGHQQGLRERRPRCPRANPEIWPGPLSARPGPAPPAG